MFSPFRILDGRPFGVEKNIRAAGEGDLAVTEVIQKRYARVHDRPPPVLSSLLQAQLPSVSNLPFHIAFSAMMVTRSSSEKHGRRSSGVSMR
jgi:hypothetical protein